MNNKIKFLRLMFSQSDKDWKEDFPIVRCGTYFNNSEFTASILCTGKPYDFKAIFYKINMYNGLENGFYKLDFNYIIGTYGQLQRIEELL